MARLKIYKIAIAITVTVSTIFFAGYILYKSKTKISTDGGQTTSSSYNNILKKSLDSITGKDSQASNNSSNSNVSQSSNSVATLGSLKVDIPNTLGNSAGNSLNGSFVSSQEKWIYLNPLAPGISGLYKSMPDGQTGLIKLDDINAWFINVVDSWIYYYDLAKTGIWKIRINGTYKTKISDEEIMQMSVKDDWIYYVKRIGNRPAIYKRKSDGSSSTQITEGFSFTLSDDGKWIYFSREDSSRLPMLYRITTDGQNETRLSTDALLSARQNGDWIYALTSDKRNIVRMQNDGSNQNLLNSDCVVSFVVHKDWIYYVGINVNSEGRYTRGCIIYKMKLDGSGKTRLNRSDLRTTTMYINVVDDWLFGISQSNQEGSSVYRLKLDGSMEGFVY
jgi:hypothetical protein